MAIGDKLYIADKQTLDIVKSNTDTLKVNSNTTIGNIAEVKSIASNIKNETEVIKNNTEFLKSSMQGLKEESFLGTDGKQTVEGTVHTIKNILTLNGSGSLKHLSISGARFITLEIDGNRLTLKPKRHDDFYSYYKLEFNLFSTDLFYISAMAQLKNSADNYVDTPTALMWIPNLNAFQNCFKEVGSVEIISLYSNASSGRVFKTGDIYAQNEEASLNRSIVQSLVYGGVNFNKSLSISFEHPENAQITGNPTTVNYSYLYTLN